jgi:pilus assembly protein CpaB
MRGRTIVLFAIALLLAGGTALLVRSWLAQRQVVAVTAPPKQPPEKSILVARFPIVRGQILKLADLAARPWPDGAISPDYVLAGAASEKLLAGSVAREPFVAGEPISRNKLVAPGERGFLAAVLHPGMRAVSIPVDVTADVSGFVFPGDRVDVLITLPVPQSEGTGGGYQHKAAETVLRDVRVIAIDQRVDTKNQEAVLARTVTLEVTPKESQIVAVAADIGKLSLSLRGLLSAQSSGQPVVATTDPPGDASVPEVTVDSDVSPLLPRLPTMKQNSRVGLVTILRGNGNNATSVSWQLAPRGS